MYRNVMALITGGSSSGGSQRLAYSVLGSATASFDFQSIPSGFSALQLVILGRGDTAAASVNGRLRFNNDSAANYDDSAAISNSAVSANPSAATTQPFVGSFPANTATASEFGCAVIFIPFYAATTALKIYVVSSGGLFTQGTTGTYNVVAGTGSWRSSAAITRVTVFPQSGNWNTGSSAVLYGLA